MASGERRHLRLAEEQDSPELHPCSEDDGLIQVGDLAKSTGKTVRAIHLYEDLGLIEPAQRSKGHYRLFAPEAKTRVRWISKLQSLGLSLSEIQSLVEKRNASDSAVLAAAELKGLYEAKLGEVREKIAELTALEAELEASLDYLKRCNTACEDHVATHSCASCSRHAAAPKKPELVAGAHID